MYWRALDLVNLRNHFLTASLGFLTHCRDDFGFTTMVILRPIAPEINPSINSFFYFQNKWDIRWADITTMTALRFWNTVVLTAVSSAKTVGTPCCQLTVVRLLYSSCPYFCGFGRVAALLRHTRSFGLHHGHWTEGLRCICFDKHLSTCAWLCAPDLYATDWNDFSPGTGMSWSCEVISSSGLLLVTKLAASTTRQLLLSSNWRPQSARA